MKLIRKKKNAGLTLLEYCAGAAVLAAFVFTAFNAIGGSLSRSMTTVGTWAEGRAAGLPPGN